MNKSVVYNSEEYEKEQEWNFRAEFQHKEYVSKGCLLAFESDGVAVSFLSNEHWKKSEIEGTYTELVEDGELRESKVKIPNVSFDENVRIFLNWYEHKKGFPT
ncbi:MAG: hypothetical protein K2O06_13935 [Acetatifactor sp.]|nr:hypothetical protein [Acetatifactor sp.]